MFEKYAVEFNVELGLKNPVAKINDNTVNNNNTI